MATALPSHPDLTHLKHQAKRLLRAHHDGRTDACNVLRHLHRFADKDDKQILAAPLALHEAQYALAMEYEFSSWPALQAHVKALPKVDPDQPGESLVNPTSLWATIDAVNEACFAGRRLTRMQRQEAAAFIAERQGKPGSYGRMFAPMDGEVTNGLRVFTGERVDSGAGSRHILGEEACRALLLLDVRSPRVQEALEKASQGILAELPEHFTRSTVESVSGLKNLPGMFCCMKCTCALWRHLLARRQGHEAFLELGVKALKAHRDGQERWRGWPFRYTLLALSEMRTPAAVAEMRYAARRCEHELASRLSGTKVHSQRWRMVLERALALV